MNKVKFNEMKSINKNLLITPKPVNSPKIRLFFFPFAGGSANTYIPWTKYFGEDIELVCVQPPGRGARFSEKPHNSMEALIDELMENSSYITSIPYVFFGHSLGCRVAFELTCRLMALGLPLPSYFIASGSRAPHLPNERRRIHNLPHDEFIRELSRLDGTPEEILSNPELMQLFMPLLRADLQIADEYQADTIPIKSPILVLYGDDDPHVNKDQLDFWRDLSEIGVTRVNIPGGHFFLNENPQIVTTQVNFTLNKILKSFRKNDCHLTLAS